MKDGEIRYIGSHIQLMTNSKEYADFYSIQADKYK